MTNVGCTGAELSLLECPHSRHHSCSHSDDAAVQCQTSMLKQLHVLFKVLCEYILYHSTGVVCHDGDVRLVNGSGRHEGRIEVCFNETWGTICDYTWNIEADIVCQQLGYSEAGIVFISYIVPCRLSYTMLHI